MDVWMLAQISEERCRAALHRPHDHYIWQPSNGRKREPYTVFQIPSKPGKRDTADLVVCVHAIKIPQCCHPRSNHPRQMCRVKIWAKDIGRF
jgi:hypothetical protein